jgi:L-ascorbate metabolism protein UlaG (beta-lactamase superfamily)
VGVFNHPSGKCAPAAAIADGKDRSGKPAAGAGHGVWLGHSSWYLQLAGKRILIDPVLSNYAAPFSFLNKAFDGDYPWTAQAMPEIDLLIISHDHYDHLDYATIRG